MPNEHDAPRGVPHALGIETLLVQRVPGLVDGRVEGIAQITRIVAGRDPHLIADAGGKGVRRLVKAAPVEIETETLRRRAD